MQDIIDELYNEVNMLNASIAVIQKLSARKAMSSDDKENLEFKLEILRDEAMKHNLKIRRSIHKLGY